MIGPLDVIFIIIAMNKSGIVNSNIPTEAKSISINRFQILYFLNELFNCYQSFKISFFYHYVFLIIDKLFILKKPESFEY